MPKREDPSTMHRRWWIDSSSSRHKEHLLGPWEKLLLRKFSVRTFSLVAAQAKNTKLSQKLLTSKWLPKENQNNLADHEEHYKNS